MAVNKAPLWEIKAVFPLSGLSRPKFAFRSISVFANPRQLGPRNLIPYCFAFSFNVSSIFLPSSPASFPPADITTAAFTPFSPNWSKTSGM